ncbi:hypothetical protein BKI52_10810 [marine bacterium AO1-C]|nr:hypothetical protein BKI52_10810 [marine bacterium AO1-C]
MKKLNYTLLFFICLLLACSTEPTEQAVKQMNEIRNRLKKAAALLPPQGQEKVVTPAKGSLPELFKFNKFSKKEELKVLNINRRHLTAILNGKVFTKDLEEKGVTDFSGYEWEMIDPDPFKNTSETKYSHEKNVKDLYDNQYLRITEIKSYTPGEVDGKTIKKPAEYKVWFWLIDLKNDKLLGSQSVEGISGNYVFTMGKKGEKTDGVKAVAGSAQGTINNKIKKIFSEWAGKPLKE